MAIALLNLAHMELRNMQVVWQDVAPMAITCPSTTLCKSIIPLNLLESSEHLREDFPLKYSGERQKEGGYMYSSLVSKN